MAAGTPDIGGLLAGLMGGAGAGGPGGDPGPGGPPPDPSQGGGGQDSIPAELQKAFDAIHRVITMENDPIYKKKYTDILTNIQAVFADEQKQKDQALGVGNLSIARLNR